MDDTELSTSELDELLDARQIPTRRDSDLQVVRAVIRQWIEQTAVENGLFSAELIDAILEAALALYADGIEAAGVICVRLIVTTSAETAAGRCESTARRRRLLERLRRRRTPTPTLRP